MQQALLSAGLPPPGIAPGQYSGRVKSYNPKQGYGFLECAEARAHYGRDVFIHKAQMGELLGRFVGPGTRLEPTALRMRVNFSVEVNKAGMPQARDVVRVDSLGEGVLLASTTVEPLQTPSLLVDGAFPSPGSSPPPPYAAPLPCCSALAAALAPPLLPPSLDSETAEGCWGDDLAVKAGIKGYKGRGGTIRILHSGEAAGLSDDLAVATPHPGGVTVIPPLQQQEPAQTATRGQPLPRVQAGGNRSWRYPRGSKKPGRGAPGQTSPAELADSYVLQHGHEEAAYHMQQDALDYRHQGDEAVRGCSGPSMDGGKGRGNYQQEDSYFRPPPQPPQVPPRPPYPPPTGQPFLPCPSGTLPIVSESVQMVGGRHAPCSPTQMQQPYTVQQYVPSGMQVYGFQGSQPLQAPQAPAGSPAAFAPQYQPQVPQQQQTQPPGPPLQYPSACFSQPYQVQTPYQNDSGNAQYSPQFLPYQQQFPSPTGQQYGQQVLELPDVVQQEDDGGEDYDQRGQDMDGYGTPQQPLSLPSTDSGSQEHLPVGCSITGLDRHGTASSVLDAVTPGSSSDDDDGRGGLRRRPDLPMLQHGCAVAAGGAMLSLPPGGCCPAGLSASGLATGGGSPVAATAAYSVWRNPDMDRAFGHSL